MQLSPYTPGQVAREVPGREAQLQEIGGMLTALHGRFSGRIRVDVGPRKVRLVPLGAAVLRHRETD